MAHDPTQRFSTRVDNYIKFRPSYPKAIIDLLVAEYGLTRDSIIADVGSGTGLLARLFLNHGNVVFGVEPNREMREAGEQLLQNCDRFTSVDGRAEATTLPDHYVDFVTAGQAFHWFDRDQARGEWERILKPNGWGVLVWNERRSNASPFLADYEQLLLSFATDYAAVNHKQVDDGPISQFFGPAGFRLHAFENTQDFDFDGLKGRLLSSSYAPEAGHTTHAPMIAELRRLFDIHQIGGAVSFEYDTQVYIGRLS